MGTRLPRVTRTLGAGLALAGAGLVLAGCSAPPSNLVKSQPYEIEEIEGSDIKRVKLADEIAANIDLQTAPAKAEGQHVVVPHESLIYNPEGQAFVYTRPVPETYVRAAVKVDRVVGERVLLFEGPAPGTAVVTVGSAELLATEYEILNQHP
jgi:hypothetical protein